jgi:hypothetical protein
MWLNIWKANGSPKQGVWFEIRNKSRREYHYSIRFVQKHRDAILDNKMDAYMLNKSGTSHYSEYSIL